MAERNYMEDIVNEVMEHALAKRDDICKCEQCREAIRNFVLERLDPHHVENHQDHARVRVQTVDNQFRADVMKELILAIEHTKNNPCH